MPQCPFMSKVSKVSRRIVTFIRLQGFFRPDLVV